MKLLILALISFFILPIPRSSSAPIPGTSTSALLNQERGIFISSHDFKISAEHTDWSPYLPSEKKQKYIITEYRSPKVQLGIQPALTVRVDQLNSNSTLKAYIKKSLRDYPRFGFNILNQKPIKINNQLAYLIDMVNGTSKRQLRQVIFVKDNVAVILTCRAHHKVFLKNVDACNSIVKNFDWI